MSRVGRKPRFGAAAPSGGGAAPRLSTGDRIGACEVVRLVGSGATSAVYEVLDPRGPRLAAKLFTTPESGISLDEALERFHRTARLCSQLRSIHVPRIHQVGVTDDGTPFTIMDLVEGEPLDSRGAAGPLDVAETLEIARQLAGALTAVHRAGVLHRDVKPANIVVTSAGVVQLLDFGICRRLHDPPDSVLMPGPRIASADDAAITQQGTLIGTPYYMAPEQVRNDPLDARVDVYAMGVVLYEMLTGRLPFEGRPEDVLTAIVHDALLPPRMFRAEIPRRVEELVVHAIARQPDDRPLDAESLQREIVETVEELGYPTGPGTVPPPADRASRPEVDDDRESRRTK